jgi:hypothetical protein
VSGVDDTPAEVSFKWRRIYTFGLGALVAIALIAQNVVVMGFYMAGASLVDYAKLAAGWRGSPTPPPSPEQATP